jgi:hypothetical protein
MNKDLYGKTFSLPEDVLGYLQQCHDSAHGANDSVEGYRRNKELRDSGQVTYQQLKRMKNWFDSFNGDRNDLSYILNGGDYVKGWVDTTLNSLRNDIHLSKKTKSVVLPNQFNSEHEKDNITDMNRPSKSHSKTIHKYDTSITEHLKRINELIQKII